MNCLFESVSLRIGQIDNLRLNGRDCRLSFIGMVNRVVLVDCNKVRSRRLAFVCRNCIIVSVEVTVLITIYEHSDQLFIIIDHATIK